MVNQHKVNDNLNNEIATRSFGLGTFEDCPCVHVLECERTKSLLELMKGLSRSHPERSSIMTYIKSQICDEENQKVRCCGQQQKTTKVRTTTNTWQQTRQISVNEEVCEINKYYILQSSEIRWFWYANFFCVTLSFSFMNALFYVNIDQGSHKEYSKKSISLGHFVEYKSLISEKE